MTASPDVRGLPVDRLETGGWELVEETDDVLFRLPGAKVVGHTTVYEDAALRRAVREASGVDQTMRFFFATEVAFSPPLSPGVGSMVRPTVAAEARRAFAEDLRERGFRNVERGRTQSIRTRSGARARLTDYRAIYPLTAEGTTRDLDVRGYLAVWHDGGFRLAGGAYPERGLVPLLADADADLADGDYREELLELVRSVE